MTLLDRIEGFLNPFLTGLLLFFAIIVAFSLLCTIADYLTAIIKEKEAKAHLYNSVAYFFDAMNALDDTKKKRRKSDVLQFVRKEQDTNGDDREDKQ